MISTKVRWSIKELEEAYQRFAPEAVRRTALVGVRAAAIWGAKRTIETKLLGQVLHRRTGTLIRSIAASPKAEMIRENVAAGTFGTVLGYGIAHEEGFEGMVRVRAHVRRLHLRTRGGRTRSAAALRRLEARGYKLTAHVEAYDRHVRIRARKYLRTTVREERRKVEEILVSAFRVLAETGKPPAYGQIAGT